MPRVIGALVKPANIVAVMATVIAGKTAFRDGEYTGALGGKLLRASAAGVC